MSAPPSPHEYLRDLYHETWGEIHRLRDLEWKIAAYFLTLSAGLLALLVSDHVQNLLSGRMRLALTLIQIVSAFFAVYYLRQTHTYLTEQRNIRRRIEHVFGFFEDDIFKDGNPNPSILPGTWKGMTVSNRFQFADLLVPLGLIVLVVQGLTIFVIWKI